MSAGRCVFSSVMRYVWGWGACRAFFTFEKGETRGGGSAARPRVSGKITFFPRNDGAVWFETQRVSN